MEIQKMQFTKGDKFKVGEDSSTYTFINVTTNKKYGFKELNAEDEFEETSSFRIDNMLDHKLNIVKL
jgi:Golgi nucleoside diphosphatase